MFDYRERQRLLADGMRGEAVDVLFLALSADLEYLTGVERGIPFFGESSYAHGWVAGAFFRPDSDPIFVLPRMVAAFHLQGDPGGELVVVNETDDGAAVFERVVRGLGPLRRVAVGDRAWAETTINLARIVGLDALRTGSSLVNELRRIKTADELEVMGCACRTVESTMDAVAQKVVPGVTMIDLVEEVEYELRRHGSRTPSFATHIFTGLGPQDLDSSTSTAHVPLREGTSVMFDFGGVVEGYCSDFGRTVYCGEPPVALREAYDVLISAYEAGLAAARPGALAREVNAACRKPIEDAGLGLNFRHRMGHAIGLDVHEKPFLSTEDETELQVGMTFTDEPSIIISDTFSIRIEDIIVCEEGGGRVLNDYATSLIANP